MERKQRISNFFRIIRRIGLERGATTEDLVERVLEKLSQEKVISSWWRVTPFEERILDKDFLPQDISARKLSHSMSEIP